MVQQARQVPQVHQVQQGRLGLQVPLVLRVQLAPVDHLVLLGQGQRDLRVLRDLLGRVLQDPLAQAGQQGEAVPLAR